MKAITSLVLAFAMVLSGTPVLRGQTVEYYHVDALGSVRVVTNAAGAIVERHDYLPYGEEWCGTAPCAAVGGQPKRFTGHERDAETGLDYFGARYYGARIGQFTTVDPLLNVHDNLLNPQKWNRYAYALDNPLRYTDPDGRQESDRLQPDIQALMDGRITREEYNARIQARGVGALIGLAGAAILYVGALGGALLTETLILGRNPAAQAFLQETLEGWAGGSPGRPTGLNLPFKSGEVVFQDFTTSLGTIEVAAVAIVKGKQLHLQDIMVYPKGSGSLPIGAREVRAIRQQMADAARRLGFDELRISGKRRTGANPGKTPDVTIDLTKKTQ